MSETPSKEEVKRQLKKDEENIPPVYEPDKGYPISDHDVYSGDILATSQRIMLVVDVTDEYAILYSIGKQRYTTYYEQYIDEDVESNNLKIYDSMLDAS